ncbi:DUF1330 domain-containing protein [Aureimonas sp. AU20]|uniref:DUF1330 domain-containing protein n=1 Tax=Aureimonas sp. AU20 TaxID=1349819 RepID=UPI0007213C1C|nr:DUF1330 domain-containing protein [Aureimonas sp. AU20]ALN71916.1 hypothetical protein M673_04255 [Aureimonas sp. AU20]
MKGYWLILKAEVSDQEAQAKYNRLWRPIEERYEARINPTKVPPLLVEVRDAPHVIVVEFPSPEAAKACYEDSDYQEARRVALRAAPRELMILQGDLG